MRTEKAKTEYIDHERIFEQRLKKKCKNKLCGIWGSRNSGIREMESVNCNTWRHKAGELALEQSLPATPTTRASHHPQNW